MNFVSTRFLRETDWGMIFELTYIFLFDVHAIVCPSNLVFDSFFKNFLLIKQHDDDVNITIIIIIRYSLLRKLISKTCLRLTFKCTRLRGMLLSFILERFIRCKVSLELSCYFQNFFINQFSSSSRKYLKFSINWDIDV